MLLPAVRLTEEAWAYLEGRAKVAAIAPGALLFSSTTLDSCDGDASGLRNTVVCTLGPFSPAIGNRASDFGFQTRPQRDRCLNEHSYLGCGGS